MLIFGGGNWPEHRLWCYAALAASVAAAAWYAAASVAAGRWLGGGSGPGLAFGVVGGLIILSEMFLWPRKKLRVVRIGRVKYWMKAHIWLGLLAVPLLAMHSGFRGWGGSLAGVLMWLFLAVIASGVWGLALQNVLPRLLLENVPAETIRSQIDAVLDQYLDEAGRLVRLTCGREETGPAGPGLGGEGQGRSFLVVGAVRASGPVQGKLLHTRNQARPVPGSEPLLAFYEATVAPYLGARARAKAAGASPLASAKRAGPIFRDVRERLDPAAHPVVDLLEDLCDQRRQFDLQARLHGWLHGWLLVHLPLSVAMTLLMFAHVYYALKYY